MIRVFDPKTNTYVLIPRDAVKVDTVQWTEDPKPPLVTDADIREEKSTGKKGEGRTDFNITLLMPFDAAHAEIYNERQDPRLLRFIQYYAGVLMGMKKLDSMGLAVRLHTQDVGDASKPLGALLNQPVLSDADIILGPYDKADIETTAAYGLEHDITVVSPWIPAFTLPSENPYFIQMYPGLATHAQATMDYIKRAMPGKKVFVVARDNPVEINRTRLFTKNGDAETEELIIRDASPDLVNTDLHSLLDDQHGTIFILPYYAKSDESFVNAFMRKLHADKDAREAIVFGLPQWTGFSNLNTNYMESLSLHLSISSFVDVEHPEYDTFRRQFLHTYHTIPDQNAFQGYDLMMWIGETMRQAGIEGLMDNRHLRPPGLASGFDIQPVYTASSEGQPEMRTPLYYENKMVRILKYVEQDFVLVR